MQRVRTVLHQGKNIVIVDLSNANSMEVLAALDEAKPLIARQGPKNARILTDVTNATYNRQVSEAIKTFTAGNTPYVHASAVTGLDAIRSVLLQAVILLTKREIKVFPTLNSALDYLAMS